MARLGVIGQINYYGPSTTTQPATTQQPSRSLGSRILNLARYVGIGAKEAGKFAWQMVPEEIRRPTVHRERSEWVNSAPTIKEKIKRAAKVAALNQLAATEVGLMAIPGGAGATTAGRAGLKAGVKAGAKFGAGLGGGFGGINVARKAVSGEKQTPTSMALDIGGGVIGGATLGTAGAIGGKILQRLRPSQRVATEISSRVKPKVEAPKATQGAGGVGEGARPSEKISETILGGRPAPTTPGKAGNIRLDKYTDLTQAEKDAMKLTYGEKWTEVEAQRRGVRSWQETEKASEEIATTVEQYSKMKPGTALNPENTQRLRKLAAGKVQELQEIKNRVVAGDNSDTTLLQLQKATMEQYMSQKALSGATAEAGRTLNIYRNTVKALQSRDSELMDAAIKKLGGREFTQDMAKKLASFAPDDVQGQYNFIRSLHKPKIRDYLEELWYNSILSGPVTHLRNTIGNTTNLAFETISQPVSAIGKRGGAKESLNTFVGGIRGLQDGINKALYVLKSGYKEESAVMLELRRTPAFKGKTGTAINIPTRLLTAADELFRSVFKSRELYGKATEIAINEGNKGSALNNRIAQLIQEPTEEMLEAASKYGARGVFQTAPDRATKALNNLTTQFSYKGLRPLKFVIPFIQTPSNILKQGLEASPAGFLRLGRETVRERNMAIARATVGSLVLGGLATYALQGRISGTGRNLTTAERDTLYRQGWQPNSIKIGDKWFSFQNINPINLPLSLVGNAYEEFKQGKKPDTASIATIALNIGNSLLDQSYLTGVSGLFSAFESPKQEGEKWLNRTIASFAVPGAVAQTARMLKPQVYKTETLKEMIKQRAGLTKGLIPKRNVWGEPITGQRATGLPIFPTTETRSKLEQFLKEKSVIVGFPGKTVGGHTLTNQEYDQYLQTSGQKIRQEIEKRVGLWRGSPSAKVQDAIQKLIDKQRTNVREKLFKKYYKK